MVEGPHPFGTNNNLELLPLLQQPFIYNKESHISRSEAWRFTVSNTGIIDRMMFVFPAATWYPKSHRSLPRLFWLVRDGRASVSGIARLYVLMDEHPIQTALERWHCGACIELPLILIFCPFIVWICHNPPANYKVLANRLDWVDTFTH